MRKKTVFLLLLLMVRSPLADANPTTNTVISPEPHSARFPPPAELTLDPGEQGIYTVTITETARYRFHRSEVTVLEETDTMLRSIEGGGMHYTIRVTNNGPWPGRTVVKVEAWWNVVSDTDGDGDGTGGEQIYGVATNIAIAGLLFEIQPQTDPGDIVCVGHPGSSVILKSVLLDANGAPHDANSIWAQQPGKGTLVGTLTINPASGTQVTVTGLTPGSSEVIAILNIPDLNHPISTAIHAMSIVKVEVGTLRRLLVEWFNDDQVAHYDVLTRKIDMKGETKTRRGLFANDFAEAIIAAMEYWKIVENPEDYPGVDPLLYGWVDGSIDDKGDLGEEFMEFVCVERFEDVTQRIIDATGPHPYHLFLYNCQHWANHKLQ